LFFFFNFLLSFVRIGLMMDTFYGKQNITLAENELTKLIICLIKITNVYLV
jgi:hypothetical protein